MLAVLKVKKQHSSEVVLAVLKVKKQHSSEVVLVVLKECIKDQSSKGFLGIVNGRQL